MQLFRGIASLLAGFILLPVLMWAGLFVVGAVWPGLIGPMPAPDTPQAAPSPGFMGVNLGLTVVMASISAAVAARLAPAPPYLWVLLLAFLVFAGGLVFGIQQVGGPTPTWYLLALPMTSGLAIAAGGWAYLRWGGSDR